MAMRSQCVGGWVPVINKQRITKGGLGSNNQLLFTLFIDNLPEEADQGWLRKTFTNYGVVKDAFLPNKRSKRTGSKFGFVRYDCHVSAGVAISKSNGLWVSDKKLFVKEASFDQYKNKSALKIPFFQRPDVGTSSHGVLRNQGFHIDIGKNRQKSSFHGKSYAQMVTGETNKGGSNGMETEKGLESSEKGLESSDQMCRRVSLKPAGNGWLYRSAVAKLHKFISINELKVQMAGMGLDNIDIKALGGRSVILTCSSRDEMEKMVKERCLQRWFSETNPWDGQAACAERFVWLCCYGMPLNVWSNTSFQSIGELWGSFIATDESTLKMSSFVEAKILIATNIFKEIDEWITVDVEGKSYKVKVMEEPCDQPHEVEKQIPRVSLDTSSNSEEESKEEEEDEDEDEDDVGVTPLPMSETNGSSSDAELDVVHMSESHCKSVSGGVDRRLNEANLDGDNMLVVDSEPSESFLDSEDSETDAKEESLTSYDGASVARDNLPCSEDGVVVFDPATEVAEPNEGFWNLSEVGFLKDKEVEGIHLFVDLNPVEEAKNSGIEKGKQKSIDNILGIPKPKKRGASKNQKSKKAGGKKKQKCVLFRAAVAAAALSSSLEGINRIHLNETQTLLSLEKIIGIDYEGNEEDIVRGFMAEDAQDAVKAKVLATAK